MKSSIRLFVAATLPENLKEKLQEQLQRFHHPNLRMIPAQNLHLTLYFIGNVPHEKLAEIKQVLQETAKRHQSFTLYHEQTEAGPNKKKPRLIWARFSAHTAFEELTQDLTQQLSTDSSSPKKPIPHITLARFRKDKPAPKDLPAVQFDHPVILTVDTISLWHSELASPHPVYSVLETYPLG
ncbi:RNA 2',3'-cyclic phosphodiesterase [Pontibacter locisalis]|uniref:RNA 2',3'-cyclic phosphodiesterase n=1 Tax=Pontibacter locisalis TaxID=1719035 RepID=A0ABW5IL55_9BACT